MKKLLLANVLALSLAACGDGNNKNEDVNPQAASVHNLYWEQTVQEISQLDLEGLQKVTANLTAVQSDALARAVSECQQNRQATVCALKVKTVIVQREEQKI